MNFIETVYNKILQMKKKVFSLDDIASFTGLEHGFDRKTLDKTLSTCQEKQTFKA